MKIFFSVFYFFLKNEIFFFKTDKKLPEIIWKLPPGGPENGVGGSPEGGFLIEPIWTFQTMSPNHTILSARFLKFRYINESDF